MKTYTAYVQQEGDDLILPLPDELLEEVGWREGDVLVWEIYRDWETDRKSTRLNSSHRL